MGAHDWVTVPTVFGIIRPCRHRLSERLRTSWWAHLCGLCLTLRDEHGQFARAATNYDGLIISALVEAQSPAGEDRRTAGPCPLRGMRTAAVSVGPGPRLAAAASLVLASAKVRDHVDDGDGVFGRRPVAGIARVVARRWADQGGGTARTVGFDTAVLLDAVGRQATVESAAGAGDLLAVTEPTETATAAACAHTTTPRRLRVAACGRPVTWVRSQARSPPCWPAEARTWRRCARSGAFSAGWCTWWTPWRTWGRGVEPVGGHGNLPRRGAPAV